MSGKVLFAEFGVYELETWMRDNKQLALFFGLPTVFVAALLLPFMPTVNPAWRSIPMLAILCFMSFTGIFLATHYMIIGLKVALPVFREDGFILPQREILGRNSNEDTTRESYLIQYSDIISVTHRKQSKPKQVEYIVMIYKFRGKTGTLIFVKGKLVHDVERFLTILRSKGVDVSSGVTGMQI